MFVRDGYVGKEEGKRSFKGKTKVELGWDPGLIKTQSFGSSTGVKFPSEHPASGQIAWPPQ